MKIKVMLGFLMLFIVGLMPIAMSASAEEQMNDAGFEHRAENMDTYIEQLEVYLNINEDGKLVIDSAYSELAIPTEVTAGIEDWISYLNNMIENGEAVVNLDYSVTMLDGHENDVKEDNKIILFASCGRSGHDLYWWGYNVFFDCNETRSVYQSFKAGGGGTVGIAAISRYIPIPPTQLASAIAGVIGGGLIGFGQMIQDEHNGNGVRMRFTGLGYAAVPTGIFPQ